MTWRLVSSQGYRAEKGGRERAQNKPPGDQCTERTTMRWKEQDRKLISDLQVDWTVKQEERKKRQGREMMGEALFRAQPHRTGRKLLLETPIEGDRRTVGYHLVSAE